MARGNNKNNNNKLFIAKIVSKKGKEYVPPHFAISEKISTEENPKGKWKVIEEVSSLSGDLFKIELDKDEYEGNEYDIIKLFLRDNQVQEDYLLDLRFNLLTRSLFNSILNLSSFEDLKVSLYEKNGSDNKRYSAVSLRQKDEKVKWRFSQEELPKIEKHTINKKVVYDTTAIDEFFLKNISELAIKINKNNNVALKRDISQPIDDSEIPIDKLELCKDSFSDEEIPF